MHLGNRPATIENLVDENIVLYYQTTYALTEVPDSLAYFHAQWRSNPLPYKEVHTIVDDVKVGGTM